MMAENEDLLSIPFPPPEQTESFTYLLKKKKVNLHILFLYSKTECQNTLGPHTQNLPVLVGGPVSFKDQAPTSFTI